MNQPLPSFTCPDCKMTSYNPNDVYWNYCGNCHRFIYDVPKRLR